MINSAIVSRRSLKGGALAAALFFMIFVTIAGTALLSSSTRNQLGMIERNVNVRLMIAVEAGVESVRGRFTLVAGVQDDWRWLGSGNWVDIGRLSINGIEVTLQAKSVSQGSVPTATVRGSATASGITRVVEYDIKIASFSDYSTFSTSPRIQRFGLNYKQVGNIFVSGGLSCPNAGNQVFGRADILGGLAVNQNLYPGGATDLNLFPWGAANLNPRPVALPAGDAQWAALRQVASRTDTYFAENTLEIEFQGTSYIRRFVQRRAARTSAGDAALPRGTGWINLANGATNWNHVSLNNQEYRLVAETRAIPDEGVIYVDAGPANAIRPNYDSLSGANAQNTWVQDLNYGNVAGRATVMDNNRVALSPANAGLGNFIQCLFVHGVISNRRVSLVSSNKIVIRDDLCYQTLVGNPNLRRFNNDGTGKQSDAALGFREMLGIMSMEDVHLSPIWWESAAYRTNAYGPGLGAFVPGVGAQLGELIPGHFQRRTSAVDAVVFALGNTRPFYFNRQQGNNELWFHGGLIAGEETGAGLGNHFARRNYDWDFRMNFTMPPYFLRAYNAPARFIPGTWRSWEA